MNSSIRDHRRRNLVSAVVVLSLLTGCSAAAPDVIPARTGTTAPSAPTPGAITSPVPSDPVDPQLVVMPASTPVAFSIPSTRTQSKLLSLALRGDGSLEVPPEGPGAPAAWYSGSPTPGERGPAVLLGHVNATGGGPGIFAELRTLKTGDKIEVTRQDGTTATFAFDRGEQYPKNAFPTQSVYGNTKGAELRLITCDGYDPETGEFSDNYVVYAKLVR